MAAKDIPGITKDFLVSTDAIEITCNQKQAQS